MSGAPARSRRDLLVAVVVVVAASAMRVLVEHVRGVVHADSDLLSLFMPTFAWWWSAARWLGGWNPWLFGGHPANADPQVAGLHPLGLLYALADPLTAATIDGVLTPALGGIGMFVYLRVVGVAPAGGLVGALSFALGGYFTGHAPNPGLLRAAAVVPWALAVVEALDGRALVAGLAATIGLLVLSGHPQAVAYALVLVLAYAALFGWRRSTRRALLLGAGLALGFGLTAGMLLPAEELIRLSSRALGEMAGHADPKLSLAAATGLFLPFPRGGGVGPLFGAAPQALAGCGLIECSGYAGTLPLLLALAGLPALARTGRGRFWLACALVGPILATGVLGAGAASLRSPVRFLVWWNVAIPVAAGFALRDAAARPTARACLAATAALAALLLAVWALDPASRRVAAGSFAVLAAAALLLALASRSRAGSGLVVAFVWIEMVAYLASLPFGVSPERYRAATGQLEFLRGAPAGAREAAAPHDFARFLVLPMLQMADWAPFAGTPLLQGYNSLLPARIAGLLGARPGAASAEIGWVNDPSLAAPSSHVLDLLRARVVAMPAGAELDLPQAFAARRAAGDPRWRSLGSARDGSWLLLANERARPLAWLVHRWRVADPEQARALVRDDPGGAFDPATEALVGEALAPPPEAAAAPADATVRVRAFADDEIRLEAATSRHGLLVTSELAYPGWAVAVDGAARPLVVVNGGFRAVALAPGRHQVVFAYRPWRSRAGLAVSAACALLLLGLALPWRRRAR